VFGNGDTQGIVKQIRFRRSARLFVEIETIGVPAKRVCWQPGSKVEYTAPLDSEQRALSGKERLDFTTWDSQESGGNGPLPFAILFS
jgi:hypothetical protein